MLYPLKFRPILKEKIWGGHKLHNKSNSHLSQKKIGESWEVSTVDGNVSIVENRNFSGKSLQDLIEDYKDLLLGKSVYQRFQNDFPILIKFIEAKENLSLQLHPDDALSKKRHNSFGKTEMWYIVDHEKDARLFVDFKKSITVSEYQDLLNQGKLESALNSIKVNSGDAFFIKPGVVHAIGAGVFLAEIQQTSEITYRLFDWNRKDNDGNTRELHTELALDAIDFTGNTNFQIQYESKSNSKVPLADTPYFKTNVLDIEGELVLDYAEVDSFIIFMNVGENEAVFVYNSVEYQLSSRETMLIPACVQALELKSQGTKLLEISI